MAQNNNCSGCPRSTEAMFREELRGARADLTVIRCPHARESQPSTFYEKLRMFRLVRRLVGQN